MSGFVKFVHEPVGLLNFSIRPGGMCLSLLGLSKIPAGFGTIQARASSDTWLMEYGPRPVPALLLINSIDHAGSAQIRTWLMLGIKLD